MTADRPLRGAEARRVQDSGLSLRRRVARIRRRSLEGVGGEGPGGDAADGASEAAVRSRGDGHVAVASARVLDAPGDAGQEPR